MQIKCPLHYTLLLQTFNLMLISTIINNHARSTRPSCRSSCCTHHCAEKLIPNPPSVSLATPTFDWNSTEQYDDFQLFHKSVDSWFTLQNVAPKILQETLQLTLIPPAWSMSSTFWAMLATRSLIDGSQLVLMLKLPRRKSGQEFLDYLLSMMDHAVLQHCRIYQLEDVCI